uniref:Lipocalin/cytosolic fatty-acid binding domain-containing protein n=1 Tax=Arion vulgaris TaxID=1028688 RepID=A0A0B7A182_9EUPU
MGVDKFLGEWLEEKKEGFDDVADAIGLSGEKRAFFKNSRSQLTYTRDGDIWSLASGIFGFTRGITHSFRLGESFNTENIDGTPLESLINTDGSRLIERHESLGQKRYTMDIVREVNNNAMFATTTIEGVSMTVIYTRS